MNRFKLAALYTLQHRLTRYTESQGGFEHGQKVGWCFLDEASAQLMRHANAPGSSWRNLLAAFAHLL